MEGNYKNLFNYKIIYSQNRRATIGFKIKDGFLLVISPKNVSQDFLINLIEKRKYWAIERIEGKKKKRNFLENNKVLYLGHEIQIDIKENNLLKNGGHCELINNILIINISKNWTQELLENIIKNWYKEECLKLIKERVNYFSEKYNFKYGLITIKEQKTVWGTCNYQNNLTFNLKIMMFEKEVIDYLIVHELTHTIHKNHSKEYWKAVENIIPNYKELNNRLKVC